MDSRRSCAGLLSLTQRQLQTPPPKICTCYTLYYSLNGDLWDYNDRWLSYQHHECTWYANNAFAFDQPDDQVVYMREYPHHDKENPCEWHTLDDVNQTIQNSSPYYKHLWLHTNNLIGSLPPEIFCDNFLTGTIPEQVYHQSNLRTFYVFQNHLSGTISNSIGKLTNLWDLQTYDNDWSAHAIPTEIGLMTSLKRVIMPRTNFIGAIPRVGSHHKPATCPGTPRKSTRETNSVRARFGD